MILRLLIEKCKKKIANPKKGGVGNKSLLERSDYKVAYDSDHMAILYTPGKIGRCIVSFTGVGHALGGIDLQTPEFSRSETADTKVFVIDKSRSWGNSLDWVELKNCVRDLSQGSEIITVGNSMGGFLALLAAKPLGASRALAFVPQWSVDANIMPTEIRWGEYRKNISLFHHPDLSNAFDCKTDFTVFFGSNPMDKCHMDKFPKSLRNLKIFHIHGGDHNVAKFLKERDLLYPLISKSITGFGAELLLYDAGVRFDKYPHDDI